MSDIFCPFSFVVIACAQKSEQPKETKQNEEVVPRVILLNPQTPVSRPVLPQEKAQSTENIESEQPPKVIPVQPKVVVPVPRELSPKSDLTLQKRPPQFMMFAFDNCTENERWQDLSAFSNQMRELDKQLEFTFF